MTEVILRSKKTHEVEDIILETKLGDLHIEKVRVSGYRKNMFESLDDILKFARVETTDAVNKLHENLFKKGFIDDERLRKIFDGGFIRNLSFVWKKECGWNISIVVEGELSSYVNFVYYYPCYDGVMLRTADIYIKEGRILKQIFADFSEFDGIKIFADYILKDASAFVQSHKACIQLSRMCAVCATHEDCEELWKSARKLSAAYDKYKTYIDYMSDNVNFEHPHAINLHEKFDEEDVLLYILGNVAYQLLYDEIKDKIKDTFDYTRATKGIVEFFDDKRESILSIVSENKDPGELLDFMRKNLDDILEYVDEALEYI